MLRRSGQDEIEQHRHNGIDHPHNRILLEIFPEFGWKWKIEDNDEYEAHEQRSLEQPEQSPAEAVDMAERGDIYHLLEKYASEMKGVFYHNAMDIVALAALLSHTVNMLHDPFDERIQHGLDVIALAKLHEDLDQWDKAARLYEQGLEMPIDEEDFWKAVRRLSVLQKRRGDLDEAIRWWEQAAEQGHVYAHVELAKHYEHRVKEFVEAQEWSQAALEIVNADKDMLEYVREHWQAELEHRLNRLDGKIKSHPKKKAKK